MRTFTFIFKGGKVESIEATNLFEAFSKLGHTEKDMINLIDWVVKDIPKKT